MAKTRAKAKANAKAKAKPAPKPKAKAKPQPKPKLGVQDKKINKAHKAKKPKKRRLHRFPKKRHFTNPWWMIPITFWILVTLSLCIVCITQANFKWLETYESLDSGCSAMHRHLTVYLFDPQSYGVALGSAFVISFVFCLLFQNVAACTIIGTTYFTMMSCIAACLMLWLLPPTDEGITCGQSLFTVVLTLSCVYFVSMSIYNHNQLQVVIALHKVTVDIYRDLPSITIGFLTFVFQLFCILLNVFSMGVVVGVLEKETNVKTEILTGIFSFFFMLLEGWIFLIVINCNKFTAGYVVGRWYFAKNQKRVYGVGHVFRDMMYHLATISWGTIYLTMHLIFKPVIDSVYYGNSVGIEGIIKSLVTLLLQPFKKTYDSVNSYGIYGVAIYGYDFYEAMKRTRTLHEIGKKKMLGLWGDTFVYTCVLLVSSLTMVFGLSFNPSNRMRWWKNLVLLSLTGLWVGLSFLITFKHMNAAYYMCVCMDNEQRSSGKDKKKKLLYSKAMVQFLKTKEKFGLRGKGVHGYKKPIVK